MVSRRWLRCPRSRLTVVRGGLAVVRGGAAMTAARWEGALTQFPKGFWLHPERLLLGPPKASQKFVYPMIAEGFSECVELCKSGTNALQGPLTMF
eukprot:2860423-Pyramimonas_sp.AAC.1